MRESTTVGRMWGGSVARQVIAHRYAVVGALPCVLAVAQLATPNLEVGHPPSQRQVECGGDRLAAIGGICHPCRAEALVVRPLCRRRPLAMPPHPTPA